jgi:hypothetical protein
LTYYFGYYKNPKNSNKILNIPFSCFARPDSFSTVPWALGPIFMFCASGLISHDTEGVGSRFQVLRSKTQFRRYSGHRVMFSCFARTDSFSAVSRASAPILMFCAPRLVFDGTKGVGSLSHVLRARTNFWWYRRRRFPFSCFARSD